MIYTVTLNPALDKTVEIPSFTTDGVNRITSIRTDPGGKGINVSKVVAALGSTSRVLGILGGSTGQMISEALSGLNMAPRRSRGGGRQPAGECSCRHLPRVGRCLPRKRCQGHSGL